MLSNIVTPNCVIKFNTQDLPGRPEEETYRSIVCEPTYKSDEFVFVGPDLRHEERRGAFNAILRFFFQTDLVQPGLHLYDRSNPSRIGGALGWINIEKLGGFTQNGDSINKILIVDGKGVEVTLPHHNVNGHPVVSVESQWLKITELVRGRWELSNGPVDKKTGKRLGTVLHGYLDILARGGTLGVAVTTSRGVNRETGEIFIDDKLNRKTAWLDRTLNIEGFEYAQAREEFIAQKIVWSQGQQFDAKTADVAAKPEVKAVVREYQQAAQQQRDAVVTSMLVTVDGKEMAISSVPNGNYKVMNGSRTVTPVLPVNSFTAKRLAVCSMNGYALVSIK
ncbi:MAG: hypothetical protein WBP54_04305 [Pelodictyon phaeoclathratiforme]